MTEAWAIADCVSKRFFATQALDQVTLQFHSGQVHAIAGENGAGKSTLMKLFGGIYTADSGEIRLGGRNAVLHSPSEAIRAGIVVIPQEMRVTPAQTVAENVMLGALPMTRRFGVIPWIDTAMMRSRTHSLLETFGILLDPDQLVSELSFAERQIVMIARALSHDARFLILDEPTAALQAPEIEKLFTVIRRLKSLNVAVAFISHYLDEIEIIADTCSILRDGQVMPHSAGDGLPARDEIVRLMTGRDVEEIHKGGARALGEVMLSAESGANAANENSIDGISVRRGEILGLAGLMGAGMSEYLRSIYGAGDNPRSIQLKNFKVELSSPSQSVGLGIGLVPRERAQGLIMGMSVRENIILPNLDKFAGARGLDKAAVDAFVTDLMESVDIRPRDPDKPVRQLSGGNQQKVIFARWLAGHIDLLLLDEPTHGVDIGAKTHIHTLMHEFAEKQGGIVFASTELTEVLSVSDTVLAMRSGNFVARISREGAYNERTLRQALGG